MIAEHSVPLAFRGASARADFDQSVDVAQVMSLRAVSAATLSAANALPVLVGGISSELFAGGISLLDTAAFTAARNTNAEAIARLSSQWKIRVLDRTAENSSRAISMTVEPVFETLLRFGPGAINLEGLNMEHVNGIHLSAILRATVRQKRTVAGWFDALAIARNALIRDGRTEEKADIILAGLDR